MPHVNEPSIDPVVVGEAAFDILSYRDHPRNGGVIRCEECDELNNRWVMVVEQYAGMEERVAFRIGASMDQSGTWFHVGVGDCIDTIPWEHGTRPLLRPLIKALEWLAEWEPTEEAE